MFYDLLARVGQSRSEHEQKTDSSVYCATYISLAANPRASHFVPYPLAPPLDPELNLPASASRHTPWPPCNVGVRIRRHPARDGCFRGGDLIANKFDCSVPSRVSGGCRALHRLSWADGGRSSNAREEATSKEAGGLESGRFEARGEINGAGDSTRDGRYECGTYVQAKSVATYALGLAGSVRSINGSTITSVHMIPQIGSTATTASKGLPCRIHLIQGSRSTVFCAARRHLSTSVGR